MRNATELYLQVKVRDPESFVYSEPAEVTRALHLAAIAPLHRSGRIPKPARRAHPDMRPPDDANSSAPRSNADISADDEKSLGAPGLPSETAPPPAPAPTVRETTVSAP